MIENLLTEGTRDMEINERSDAEIVEMALTAIETLGSFRSPHDRPWNNLGPFLKQGPFPLNAICGCMRPEISVIEMENEVLIDEKLPILDLHQFALEAIRRYIYIGQCPRCETILWALGSP